MANADLTHRDTTTVTLRYGVGQTLRLDLPSDHLLACSEAPQGAPLADVAAAAAAALDAPLEFPPLARATVPGDRIAIALGDGVPQAASIVRAVVERLVSAGAAVADMTILRTQAEVDSGSADPRSGLSAGDRATVQLQTHNPNERSELSYLGVMPDGSPIYLNRTLFDADLIVPIGCARLGHAVGYHGMNSVLFPAFADSAAMERTRVADLIHKRDSEALTDAKVNEVAWLIGVPFSIQVVPGGGEAVLAVIAGESAAVMRAAEARLREAWSCPVPERASLVVAAIEGGPQQQTWENVARALATASQLVADDGAIALCCELAVGPGPAMQRLAGADDLAQARRRIRKQPGADALPAVQIFETLQRARVYLLSRLDEVTVEDLGLAHVGQADDIARLAGRSESCIVLNNAQHVQAGGER